MFRLRRLHYSQNFLRDPELVCKLIRKSSIGLNDTIVEIGPGKGLITEELIKVAGRVIAVELDSGLYSKLNTEFQHDGNIELVHTNILTYDLPKIPFKVFSNIPFNISADIIRKLTSNDNFQEGYLIVQKEFAQKLIGMPYDNRNQMMSVLLKPWFEISVMHEFKRSDYIPKPNVDSVMIRIIRLNNPIIENNYGSLYRKFIIYSFNKYKVSRKSFAEILYLFNCFLKRNNPKEMEIVTLAANKINDYQNKILKIHRTRNDKRWRNG